MTDPQPTPVDDIIVVGQRRRPGGSFPPASGAGSGGLGEGGIEQDELDPDGQPSGGASDPCDNSETAVPWNADAAAAAAVAAFLQAAEQLGGADAPGSLPNLGQREFGRGLYRDPSGAIVGNAVSWGGPPDENGVSTFDLDMSGITNLTYIGDAHSHPNGNPLPSQEDWDGFMRNNNSARGPGQRVNDTFYLYIITVEPDGSPGPIYVYQDGPRAAGSPDPARPTTIGPEVNPDAQPCP